MIPPPHRRRSIRLPDYDYSSAGAYFVTVCTRNRDCVFDDPILAGIVAEVWQALPSRFPTIALDEFVIMLNHVHLIVWLRVGATLAVAPGRVADTDKGAGASPAPTVKSWVIPKPEAVNAQPTLGDVIGALKSLSFVVYYDWIQAYDPKRQAKFWQRN